MRPREIVKSFDVVRANRRKYKGVTIGDIHRAANLIANYAECLENFVVGLHQRLDEIQDICKNGPLNFARKKCGHGPEMLKVVDLYCAQCVKEVK
mgnify:FL=1